LLLDKLRGELSGILNWALEGCLSWQREGIPSPDAVRDATGAYRDECDPIAQFFEDCAILDERLSIPKGDLHKAFARWAKDNELPAMSTKMFGTRLKEKGFADKQGTGGARFWLGISLISPDSPETGRSDKDTK